MKPRQLNSRLHGWSLFWPGIWVGNIHVPARLESQHFLVFGRTGAGKSTLIRQLLRQIRARGEAAIVLDRDCEFLSEFYDEQRGDVVLNPLDRRCPFWSPWMEFREEGDIAGMIGSLIREKVATAGHAYYQGNSKRLLEKLFQHCSNLGELRAALEKSTDDGVANAMRPLTVLPREEQASGRWSAAEWSKHRRGWLFMSSVEKQRSAIYALQGIWLDLLIGHLLSEEGSKGRVWIVADEFADLGYQPRLEQALVRGRKREISVVIGTQNFAQIRQHYGQDGAITITDQPATKIILQSGEPETVRRASDLLGSYEVETDSKLKRIEPLVLPAEIQKLRVGRGYIAIDGYDRARLRIPNIGQRKRVEPFIQRAVVERKKDPRFDRPISQWPEYRIVDGIINRCTNPKSKDWQDYGGRGITVVERWRDRKVFTRELVEEIGWREDQPMKNPTVNRINNDGPYGPGNIEWQDMVFQRANRRDSAETKSLPVMEME